MSILILFKLITLVIYKIFYLTYVQISSTSLGKLLLIIGKIAYMTCVPMILISFCKSLWKTCKEGWAHLNRLHQIPCHQCAFFTGNYHLKCTVYPSKALNEEAIDCLDYEQMLSS